MPISITHPPLSSIPVQGNAANISPKKWLAEHIVTGNFMASDIEDADARYGGYDLAAEYNGVLSSHLLLMHHIFTRQVTFPSGLSGSMGSASTPATTQCDFDIKKNGANVGTMRYPAGSASATFLMASQQTFSAGDILKVVSPVTPDATLSDITFTLFGSRY